MNSEGGFFNFTIPLPSISLSQVFADIKAMQKDNLTEIPIESK